MSNQYITVLNRENFFFLKMNLLVFFNLVNNLATDLAGFKIRRSCLPFICRYFLLLSPFFAFFVLK